MVMGRTGGQSLSFGWVQNVVIRLSVLSPSQLHSLLKAKDMMYRLNT